MAIFKRCSSGQCDEPKPNPSLKPGGVKGVAADMVYQCASNATTPCPPAGSSCACFIVVSHHKPDTSDDDIVGEEHFPPAPDPTAKDPYAGMLTQADVNANYKQLTRKVPGPAKQEYWIIAARCLQVNAGGTPLTALRVSLTVPGEAYASTLRELERKYGAANVSLIPPPPDPPAKRKIASRKPGKASTRKPAKKSPARAVAKQAKKKTRS
jgi:hypothetical protein